MKRTLATLTLLAAAGPARADLRHVSNIGARNDRPGIGVFSDTGWRTRLFDSPSRLLQDTYLDVGITTQLSPATLHPGVYIETVPIAILKLRASVQRLQYFGYFGSLHTYPDGDWAPERLAEAGREHSGDRAGGYLYDARANLRAKAWRIVVSVEGQLSHFDLEADAPVHEPVSDMLVGPHDELWQSRSMVGFTAIGEVQKPGSLMVGYLHQHLHAFDTDVTRHLPGLVALMKPPAAWWSAGDPTIALLLGMYADDPYREGNLYVGTLWTLTFERTGERKETP